MTAPDFAGLKTHTAFTLDQWRQLRANTSLTITEQELEEMRGVNENLSITDVEDIYLPLSRLLSLYVAASQHLYRASDTFLGKLPAKVPYIIGIAGSVAVGKSTTARLLQTLLSRWPGHPHVELVTTDGFLYPNDVLKERNLMDKKGFPESYRRRDLVDFLYQVKSGVSEVAAPVYSHLTYDIVPDQTQVVAKPDVLLVEGLTVLQTTRAADKTEPFASDFFDFSLYLDASAQDLQDWYVQRFLTLQQTAFTNPNSYFRNYSDLTVEEAKVKARSIWDSINLPNLVENILPTRPRADLILKKQSDHSIDQVLLRKL